MSRRRLSPEESALWRQVADTADPLHPHRPPPGPTARAKPKPPLSEPREAPPVAAFSMGQSSRDRGGSHDLMKPMQARLAEAPVRMDRKAHTRMTRGKLKPEARIDLHGMTLDRAHGVLTGFVLRAHLEGKRLLLVITGKGRDRDDDDPIPTRRGVLRHNVPHWLQAPPLSSVVLQITPAHIRHGGGGAYYVYLRRPQQ